MGSFYEIIKNLKIPDEKRKPEKKRAFKIKPRILFLSLLSLIVLSGLSLLVFSYYIKNFYINIKSQTPQVKVPQSTSSQVNTASEENLKPSILPSQVSIVPKESLKPSTTKEGITKPISSFKNVPVKSVSVRNHVKESITLIPSETKEEKEPPIEGFLLTKEDLLNNLLLVAEEERKEGNCKKAIFYYKSYLKEKENPLVMNNLGACLIEVGEFDSAINIFNKAFSLKNDPEIKYNLIIAYLKKGDKEKACYELKKLDTASFLDEKINKLKELCK